MNPRSDGHDQGDYQSLDVTKTFGLQVQHGEHVRRRDDAAPHQRNAKKQLQSDGRADNFGQITGGNGNFAKNPEKPDCWC
jgi:hypothetical protein